MRKVSDKQKEKLKLKKDQRIKRRDLFIEIWEENEKIDSSGEPFVICFESGGRLYNRFYKENSCCYSHILEKSKYPQYDLVKKNIKIVHPDWHSVYESNREDAPNQNKLRKELLELHYLDSLKD